MFTLTLRADIPVQTFFSFFNEKALEVSVSVKEVMIQGGFRKLF